MNTVPKSAHGRLPAETIKTDVLFFGDNLHVLRENIPAEAVDLVYADPPFNSARNYSVIFKDRTGRASAAQEEAFTDTWSWTEDSERWYREIVIGPNAELATATQALRSMLRETPMMAYLAAMAIRLVEIHRVLRPTGSFWLHCDPTASHYLKVLLDAIFGPANFRNEVVWQRTTAHGDAKRKFGDVNDTLLFYSKSDRYTFHPQKGAYDAEYLAREFSRVDAQGRRYALADTASPNPRPNLMYEYRGYPPPKMGWRYSRERMEQLDAEGRLLLPAREGGRIRLIRYLDEQKGMPIGNVWTDIPPVHVRSSERLGYPTQKPLALLERIIAASTDPGDVVLDPYCGCGTAVVAAHRMGRRWLGIDITAVAVAVMKARLENAFDGLKGKIVVEGFPTDLEGARQLFELDPYRFQAWACALVDAYPLTKKGADGGIDGNLPFLDLDDTPRRAVVQVKGGKLTLSQVRDFCHVVSREKAALGFLVCLGDVTEAMKTEAVKEGCWDDAGGFAWPRVQILPVAQLLEGRVRARYPAQDKISVLGYKAARSERQGLQTALFSDAQPPGGSPPEH